MRDLLDIVKTKLLVIGLPKASESSLQLQNISVTNSDKNYRTYQSFRKHRASAAVLVKALDDILQHVDRHY